jgi:hypothetical protein
LEANGFKQDQKAKLKAQCTYYLSKLFKYPKIVEPQLVIKLLLNLLCIVSPWFPFCDCKILMLIVQFNLLFANPKTFLCCSYVQSMLGDIIFIIQRYKNNNV